MGRCKELFKQTKFKNEEIQLQYDSLCLPFAINYNNNNNTYMDFYLIYVNFKNAIEEQMPLKHYAECFMQLMN